VIYQSLQAVGVERGIAGLAGMVSTAALRVGAIIFNWTLPVFTLPGPEDR
jgi:uncharacterized membrane protein YeiH